MAPQPLLALDQLAVELEAGAEEGDVAIMQVFPTTDPQAEETADQRKERELKALEVTLVGDVADGSWYAELIREGRDIREAFKGGEYQVLLVANKFQTGFDQPLLCGNERRWGGKRDGGDLGELAAVHGERWR